MVDIPVYTKFATHLENSGILPIKVAADLNISRSHLSRVLAGKRELSESLRAKLNTYLSTEF